jgi:hypothetical protein
VTKPLSSPGIVGLTQDPDRTRRYHKNPMGWTVEGPFLSENTAREWKSWYLGLGYTGTTDESGWRYGFRFPIAEMKD